MRHRCLLLPQLLVQERQNMTTVSETLCFQLNLQGMVSENVRSGTTRYKGKVVKRRTVVVHFFGFTSLEETNI